MSEIGAILTELREDKNLTQKELAEIFHLSGSSISAYEIGTRVPNLEILIEYVKFFDVSANYILGLTPHPDSLSSLNEEFLPGILVGDVIQDMKSLTREQKEVLIHMLKYMRLYADISRKTTPQKDGFK